MYTHNNTDRKNYVTFFDIKIFNSFSETRYDTVSFRTVKLVYNIKSFKLNKYG